MSWLKGKLWPFVKAHWKAIALFALGIAAAWGGRKLIGVAATLVRGVLVPRVQSPVPFSVLDSQHVGIRQADGTWQAVDVKKLGVEDAGKVTAVGRAQGGVVEVQLDHPAL